MAESLSVQGQLSIVKVRPHPNKRGRYQLVFGHRRLAAARSLGWKTIKAEVVELTDEKMLEESLIENLERENISDFDKALVFQRLNRDFHKTYEEIAALIGTSKQNISNHIGMLDLFNSEEISNDPQLDQVAHSLSEHHARLLEGLQDRKERIALAKSVVNENMSVRELDHVISRLREWPPSNVVIGGLRPAKSRRQDPTAAVQRITGIVMDYMRFAREGRWHDFMEMHLLKDGFTMYDDLPPHHLLSPREAYSKKREWVKVAAPKMTTIINALKVDVLKGAALVTLDVSYSGRLKGVHVVSRIRGTLVLVERRKSWKILHEHWSKMDDERGRGSVVDDLIDSELTNHYASQAPFAERNTERLPANTPQRIS